MSKRDLLDENNSKLIAIFSVTLVISVIVFLGIFSIYNNKRKEEANLSALEYSSINTIVPNENNTTVTTSGTQDKTINMVSNNTTNTTNNTIKSNNILNITATTNSTKKQENTTTEKTINAVENVTSQETTNTTNESNAEIEEQNVSQELNFKAPVSGEILKDYANDSLVYSNTLEEWTTHLGVDIKAPRTTVVGAAEKGKIESIKNDPRYGLTITIDHGNGYKTIYANLLTTEFVQIGDEVEQGETIATVGDSSSFEILDEPHLHFEMIINGENVNPTAYLK